MHQTTLRFGADLWHRLEEEAAAAGISVAQYVREAALIRASQDAARRAEPSIAPASHGVSPSLIHDSRRATEHAADAIDSAAALWEQARLARERAARLRQDATRLRPRS